MFWLPGLSLVIFFLVMIPFIIYGFKKGWVYALTFSITLWLVTLIFIGINYAIYKYLWKAFHALILKRIIKVDMNLDNLSNFYKTQVVLFATGIEFILIYPITFLLVFLNNKYIRKYFGHKVRIISMSEKEIIYKRNIKFSRIAGTAILTTTTLFSTSFLASVINGITIPYKKSNFANYINDSIGKIYSLGLAKNSKSSQIISNFIGEDLDNKIATSMRELVNFSSLDEQLNNVFPNIKEIRYLESQIQKFKELFGNDKATKAIFTSVIHQTKKTLNPLLFDDYITTSNQDANLNTIGYNKATRLNNLEALKTYVVDNKIKIFFKEALINVLVEKITKLFVDFKDTIFYKNYDEAIKKRDNYEEALNKKIDENKKLQENLIDFKVIRKQLINLLIQISGEGIISQGNWDNDEVVSFSIKSISRTTPRTGTFWEEVKKETDKKNIEQKQLNIKNTKTTNYHDYKGEKYDFEKQKVDDVQTQYDEAKNALEVLNQEKANLESAHSSLKATQVKVKAEKQELSKAVPKSEKDIESNRQKINDLELKIIQSIGNIASKDQQILTKKADVDSKKTQLDGQKRVFSPFEHEEAQLKKIKDDATLRYEQVLATYILQKNKVDKLANKYEITINELKLKNDEIISVRKTINELETKKDELIFVSPAKKWDKKDDGSMFYHQELIKFSNNKIQQLQNINIDKETRFKILKNKITSFYREWLGG